MTGCSGILLFEGGTFTPPLIVAEIVYENNNLFTFLPVYVCINLSVTHQNPLNESCSQCCDTYSNVEYADIIFVYDFCNGNATEIVRKYAKE